MSVSIPQNAQTVITGVAGSGKSSLIKSGFAQNPNAIFINQKGIHASSRSNLLTYMGVFDEVRAFFSQNTGLKKAMFSYNSDGACPNCNGKGVIKTELAFMPSFSQTCEVCHGTRYRPEVLEAKVEGYSIADVLALTVEEAISLFKDETTISKSLIALQKTGLSYMTLGQSLDTLSGGEIQRLKLSRYMTDHVSGKIFIFDEPTTGLHEDDIPILQQRFEQLVQDGNTVILIEHNLTMMTQADWLIDIGPGAGTRGGQILFSGPPQRLIETTHSATAQHLADYIHRQSF